MTEQVSDGRARAARRVVLIDALPVVTLGWVALALGSNPEQTPAQRIWWVAATAVFALGMAWVLLRAFRRADEYLRKIQLESMAVALAAVLVALQVAAVLDAAGVVALHQVAQPIVIGGMAVWHVIADLRTRFTR
ncbi:hypothetical protein Aph02nite_31420 [Actinoplanes philippinensis]|nr:hypothetical protein [Actinoplanes philippinensis]GIE77192.1 hypothetical protein Aph02nite_31420 [Actinoplanes philippinensis]